MGIDRLQGIMRTSQEIKDEGESSKRPFTLYRGNIPHSAVVVGADQEPVAALEVEVVQPGANLVELKIAALEGLPVRPEVIGDAALSLIKQARKDDRKDAFPVGIEHCIIDVERGTNLHEAERQALAGYLAVHGDAVPEVELQIAA